MTEVQKQIEELNKKVVQAAKADDLYLVTAIGDQVNDLREIDELEKELVQISKDGDTITAYTLANKINDLKENLTAKINRMHSILK